MEAASGCHHHSGGAAFGGGTPPVVESIMVNGKLITIPDQDLLLIVQVRSLDEVYI